MSQAWPLDTLLYNDLKTSLGATTYWFSGTDCEILRVGGNGLKRKIFEIKVLSWWAWNWGSQPGRTVVDDIRLMMDKLRWVRESRQSRASDNYSVIEILLTVLKQYTLLSVRASFMKSSWGRNTKTSLSFSIARVTPPRIYALPPGGIAPF